MAVFKGNLAISGSKLTDILAGATVNGKGLSHDEWTEIQNAIRGGGARIIKLRGRSSFQSPAHQTVEMLRGRIRNGDYPPPLGVYFVKGPHANVSRGADTFFNTNRDGGSIS